MFSAEQSINDALTALLPARGSAGSAATPEDGVSCAVPPDLSGVVLGNFDISLEPHGGDAGTYPTESEEADEEESQLSGN